MDKFYIIMFFVTIFTIIFRISPVFLKIPEHNKKINKFFEYLPVSILTILAFPEIFTSIGESYIDIFITIFAMIIVVYLAIKKKSMGFTLFISFIIIVILKGVFDGKF